MRVAFDQIELEVNHLGYVAPKPGWYIAPHSHQQYEMHFITRGKGINKLKEGQAEFYRNVVYMAPPGEVHEQFSDLSDPMEIFFIPFSISGLHKDLPRIYAPFPLIHNELLTIRQLQEHVGALNLFHVQIRLIELIWSIISPQIELQRARELGDSASTSSQIPSVYTSSQQIVEKALLYIHNHKLANPAIEEIAAACHISSRQLSRVFSKSMHSTIHEFIQHERYLWACRELLQTNKAIAEISDELHLGSKPYFSSWFKSFALKSPSQFRKEQERN
ncbi:AraC family transcriptional regulator [Paenibacillus eucommiae]|uniref:AraC-like DNA-binding protein n=1 Tax=Paenibacillus eucommiae TaxID=1355755 RepID=A0ABS4J1P7_9BACL|nr:AraC family transcriptional regulator [Paenibacillus eucommiae]MBP1993741.1 AraC-like DNA-binding protein [Paenibacillus eucommiae]